MSKYGASGERLDGIWFPSQAEIRRYRELILLLEHGHITDLEVHKRYPLRVNGVEIGAYECDFCYREVPSGRRIVEDVKGVRTRLYVWKRKHFEVQYGTQIQEVEV